MKIARNKYFKNLILELYNQYKNEAINKDDLRYIWEDLDKRYGKTVSSRVIEKLERKVESEKTHLLESACGEKEIVAEDLINEKNNYCIDEYKKYSGYTGEDILTEETLDTWALERVSAENNYDYDDLKNLLLGGK